MVGKNLLIALLVITATPMASAQWLDDDDADAHETVGGVEQEHGRSGSAEIHHVDLEETKHDITFTVAHGDVPEPAVVFEDAVFYNLAFKHGMRSYEIYARMIIPIGGTEMTYFAELYGGDQRASSHLADLDIEASAGEFSVKVAKSLLLDENGAAPAAGSSLTEFVATSDKGLTVICIGECVASGPASNDRVPNADSASYDFQFGIAQEGDIRLQSPAPVRWSNGAATTFVYEVLVSNLGAEEVPVTFLAKNVPKGWDVSQLQSMTLAAGDTQQIGIAVRVPFAHEHGTDPRFVLEALASTGIGRIELGVHYPATPQPTGHHPQVYFHTRARDVNNFEDAINTAIGTDIATYAYMNTVESHDGDENVPVGGTKDGVYIDEPISGEELGYGVRMAWPVRLSPGLQVGLLTEANSVTEGNVQLAFDVPVGEVQLWGRLAVVPTDEFDDEFNFEPDVGQQLGVIPLTDKHAIANTVSIPIKLETGDPQSVDFAPGQDLVLYLYANVIRPDTLLGPNTGVALTGGDLMLPLREHHDVIPVELALPDEVQQEAAQQLDAAPDSEEAKGAPTVGPVALMAAIGVILALRRQTTT